MSNKAKANILLLITAFIWGTAFVAQKEGGAIGAFTFNGIRTFLGGLVLIPFILVGHKRSQAKGLPQPDHELGLNEVPAAVAAAGPLFSKLELIGGFACGTALFVAGSLQQFGLAFTTAGKAAFITTLYVVFCPILSMIITKKKTRPLIWICVLVDCVGLYLLCMTDASFSIQIGDTLVILCAVAFAMQMVLVDVFIGRVDGLKLSCIQFLVAGLEGMICMLIFEQPIVLSDILSGWFPILYAGVMSCGIGYTFQVLGQRYADPAVAALILCLESVFGVLAGAVLLHETMSPRELLGCAIMFAVVVVSNLPEKKKGPEAPVEGGGVSQ